MELYLLDPKKWISFLKSPTKFFVQKIKINLLQLIAEFIVIWFVLFLFQSYSLSEVYKFNTQYLSAQDALTFESATKLSTKAYYFLGAVFLLLFGFIFHLISARYGCRSNLEIVLLSTFLPVIIFTIIYSILYLLNIFFGVISLILAIGYFILSLKAVSKFSLVKTIIIMIISALLSFPAAALSPLIIV